MAVEGDDVWVTGFEPEQITRADVQAIPYKRLYVSNGRQLFPIGSRLPERPEPALLWSPIERGLPLTLPTYRGNYVDLSPVPPLRLVHTIQEQTETALLVAVSALRTYVETAPAVRMKPLSWVLLNAEQAFVLGGPLLPLPGPTYWQQGQFLFPVGYDLDLPLLVDDLNSHLNPIGQDWLLWHLDGTYDRIPRTAFQILSIRSVRTTSVVG